MAILSQSIKYRDDPSGIIEDTRMPGFNISNDPTVPGLGPCPDTWGNGTQVRRAQEVVLLQACVLWGQLLYGAMAHR